MVKAVDKAKTDKLKMEAALHGMKLKPGLTSLGLTKEERAESIADAEDACKRLQARYEEKQNKEGKECQGTTTN